MAPSTAASPPQKRTRASFVPSAAATSTSTPPPPTQSSLRLRQRHNLFQSKTIDDKLDHEPSPKRVKSNEGQDLTEGSPSSSLSPAPPLDPPKPKPKPKPKAKSRPSKVPASSTGPFLPVSNLEFVQKYAVEGMQEAEVYYMPAFVDRETASLWREELQGLDECGCAVFVCVLNMPVISRKDEGSFAPLKMLTL